MSKAWISCADFRQPGWLFFESGNGRFWQEIAIQCCQRTQGQFNARLKICTLMLYTIVYDTVGRNCENKFISLKKCTFMKTVISSLESTAETLLKLTGTALKFSIALGSACVIIYALRVGHFPQGLTLGDGLLFLLAASCFGFVYVMFVGCLVSLGICLSVVVRPILNFVFKYIRKRVNPKKEIAHELALFHWGAIPFALVAVVLIWTFGQREIVAYWNLPLLSVALYIFYSIAKSAGAQYRRHERLLNSVIVTRDKDELQSSGEAEKQKSAYLVSITAVMLLPLVMGGVSGLLMDGAMRMAQIRIEHAAVYVKAPYNALIPDALVTKETKAPEGYKGYAGVIVQFKGFGNTTVIAFKDDGLQRQLDIPNDQIIVEKKTGG